MADSSIPQEGRTSKTIIRLSLVGFCCLRPTAKVQGITWVVLVLVAHLFVQFLIQINWKNFGRPGNWISDLPICRPSSDQDWSTCLIFFRTFPLVPIKTVPASNFEKRTACNRRERGPVFSKEFERSMNGFYSFIDRLNRLLTVQTILFQYKTTIWSKMVIIGQRRHQKNGRQLSFLSFFFFGAAFYFIAPCENSLPMLA